MDKVRFLGEHGEEFEGDLVCENETDGSVVVMVDGFEEEVVVPREAVFFIPRNRNAGFEKLFMRLDALERRLLEAGSPLVGAQRGE